VNVSIGEEKERYTSTTKEENKEQTQPECIRDSDAKRVSEKQSKRQRMTEKRCNRDKLKERLSRKKTKWNGKIHCKQRFKFN